MEHRKVRQVEVLLDVRRRLEREARLAFQRALGEAERAAQRLVALDRRLGERNRRARRALLGGAAGGADGTYRSDVAALVEEMGRYRGEIRRLDTEMEARRRALAAARRERQAAERMRDRLAAEVAAEDERREAAEVDDAFAGRVSAASANPA